jgi:hypothetical protein
MWEIKPGIEFASKGLLDQKFNLSPAFRLDVARKYQLKDWIPAAVRHLLHTPLAEYSEVDMNYLGYSIFSIIAIAKEQISTERVRLSLHAPMPPPKDIGDRPYCNKHKQCMKIWSEKWFLNVIRRIHNSTFPLPLSDLCQVLEETNHEEMNNQCKNDIISWLRGSKALLREEDIIRSTIATITNIL